MRLTAFKRTIMTSALAIATVVAGAAGQAQAFLFGDGDLVLAIYGNNTEALYNLGNASAILAPGGAGIVNRDVSAGLAAAGVGTNPVRYTVFGGDSTTMSVLAGTSFASGSINPNLVALTNQLNPMFAMMPQATFAGDTIAKSDARSFSSNLDQAGTGMMMGAWPVAMRGDVDQIINIMNGDVNTNTFTQVGRVLLTSTGLLTVGNPGPLSAVPLPAGVVLFGSGLIGLIGIARRSFNRMAA